MKQQERYFIIIFFLHFSFMPLFAQKPNKADSILSKIKSGSEDSIKVRLINEYGRICRATSVELADSFFKEGVFLSRKINFNYGIIHSLINRGKIKMFKSEFAIARDSFLLPAKAIALREGDNQMLGVILNLMGDIYTSLSKYNDALSSYNESIKFFDKSGNEKTASSTVVNIGNLYSYQGNTKEALRFYNLAYQRKLKINDPEGTARALINMSGMNSLLKNFPESIRLSKEAERICDAHNLTFLKSYIYQNLCNTFVKVGKADSAIYYYDKVIAIHRLSGEKSYLATALNGKANAYIELKKYEEALECVNEALQISIEVDSKADIMNAYSLLGIIYFTMNQFKEAYLYVYKYSNLKDSLINEKSTSQMNEMQTKYETAKKDKELLEQDSQIKTQKIEGEKRAVERNAFVVGFALLLIVVFFIFKAYRQKKKSNDEIVAQKKIIEEQKMAVDTAFEKLHEKNKEVMDSIYYARRIQRALITSERYIQKTLNKLQH